MPTVTHSAQLARTETALATLDPKAAAIFREFIGDAVALADKSGCQYIAISGNRTYAEQDALYAKGRTAPGAKVTNAKGGQSNHNFGIALDFGVFQGGKYLDDGTPEQQLKAARIHRAIGTALAERHKLEWGGTWKGITDEPHFEIKTGLTLAEKRARYASNGSVL